MIRKSRLGVDAILPGNTPSQMWADDELIELMNEARDEIDAVLRISRKNYLLQTVEYGDSAFTRAGVTYDPSVSLLIAAADSSFELPPDYAEISKLQCVDNTTVRFTPGEYNSQYWIDLEQDSKALDGTFTPGSGIEQLYNYDVIGERTLAFVPPAGTSMQLKLDYFPIKRQLAYTIDGTLSLAMGATTGVITGGQLVTQGIFSRASGQAAELIIGVTDLADTKIRLDREYPILDSITDDAHFTLVQAWTGATVQHSPFMIAMAPTTPLPVHRAIATLCSAKMLKKVSVDLSDRYSAAAKMSFLESIKPATTQRQSQESRQTDACEELGT